MLLDCIVYDICLNTSYLHSCQGTPLFYTEWAHFLGLVGPASLVLLVTLLLCRLRTAETIFRGWFMAGSLSLMSYHFIKKDLILMRAVPRRHARNCRNKFHV